MQNNALGRENSLIQLCNNLSVIPNCYINREGDVMMNKEVMHLIITSSSKFVTILNTCFPISFPAKCCYFVIIYFFCTFSQLWLCLEVQKQHNPIQRGGEGSNNPSDVFLNVNISLSFTHIHTSCCILFN